MKRSAIFVPSEYQIDNMGMSAEEPVGTNENAGKLGKTFFRTQIWQVN